MDSIRSVKKEGFLSIDNKKVEKNKNTSAEIIQKISKKLFNDFNFIAENSYQYFECLNKFNYKNDGPAIFIKKYLLPLYSFLPNDNERELPDKYFEYVEYFISSFLNEYEDRLKEEDLIYALNILSEIDEKLDKIGKEKKFKIFDKILLLVDKLPKNSKKEQNLYRLSRYLNSKLKYKKDENVCLGKRFFNFIKRKILNNGSKRVILRSLGERYKEVLISEFNEFEVFISELNKLKFLISEFNKPEVFISESNKLKVLISEFNKLRVLISESNKLKVLISEFNKLKKKNDSRTSFNTVKKFKKFLEEKVLKKKFLEEFKKFSERTFAIFSLLFDIEYELYTLGLKNFFYDESSFIDNYFEIMGCVNIELNETKLEEIMDQFLSDIEKLEIGNQPRLMPKQYRLVDKMILIAINEARTAWNSTMLKRLKDFRLKISKIRISKGMAGIIKLSNDPEKIGILNLKIEEFQSYLSSIPYCYGCEGIEVIEELIKKIDYLFKIERIVKKEKYLAPVFIKVLSECIDKKVFFDNEPLFQNDKIYQQIKDAILKWNLFYRSEGRCSSDLPGYKKKKMVKKIDRAI